MYCDRLHQTADYIQMQPEGYVTKTQDVTDKVTKMQKEEIDHGKSFI